MKEKHKKILVWILETLLNLAIILILVIVIQKWIIAPFDVSGQSMCNTLNFIDGECKADGIGEKIIINEAVYLMSEPERGEIVVFESPHEDDKYFIKRIIGIPGDIIELRDGYVYLQKNGEKESKKVNESYLNESNLGHTQALPAHQGPTYFKVPEGKYFMLGDNRNASTDSRSCFQSSLVMKYCQENPDESFIEKDKIRGRAWLVWWPISNMKILKTP